MGPPPRTQLLWSRALQVETAGGLGYFGFGFNVAPGGLQLAGQGFLLRFKVCRLRISRLHCGELKFESLVLGVWSSRQRIA